MLRICVRQLKSSINKGRTQVVIAHREGVLCILLIVKLAPQADTGSNRMQV